jgi:4-hydroxy-3-methylbut-2-en-1-yl diphosphate synthase IspG/GcpE
LVALLLNTEGNAATGIAVRVAAALGTLKSAGVLATVRLGLASAPLDAVEAERLLGVSRDRAAKNESPGISPPEAIH